MDLNQALSGTLEKGLKSMLVRHLLVFLFITSPMFFSKISFGDPIVDFAREHTRSSQMKVVYTFLPELIFPTFQLPMEHSGEPNNFKVLAAKRSKMPRKILFNWIRLRNYKKQKKVNLKQT